MDTLDSTSLTATVKQEFSVLENQTIALNIKLTSLDSMLGSMRGDLSLVRQT